MKKIIYLLLIPLLSLSACETETMTIDPFYFPSIYEMIKRDTTYSEFARIIDKAGYEGMLRAYGDYGCLAPVNEAFRTYYKSKGPGFRFENLTQAQVDSIARTHILQCSFLTYNQQEGFLPMLNMNSNAIYLSFGTNATSTKTVIYINDSSQIITKDIKLTNGVIHSINRLLIPSNASIYDVIGKNPDFSIFYEALKITKLCDSISKFKDDSYVATQTFKDFYNVTEVINPKQRLYGYTILAEDNQVLKAAGIHSLNDLIQKAKLNYPADATYDTDFSNAKNSLHQYMSYHLLNKLVCPNRLVFTRNTFRNSVPDEFWETMLANRIIKLSVVDGKYLLNANSPAAVELSTANAQQTLNGIYYRLNQPLMYNQAVENMLLNTRIRFDAASLFPELTNNDIRASQGKMVSNSLSGDQFGFEPSYLKNVQMTPATKLYYVSGIANERGCYQADMFLVTGRYDLNIRTLPLPPGTYELRMGYFAHSSHSTAQLYVDGVAVGSQLNFSIPLSHPSIGYLMDYETEDNGYENDKNLRNKGYMKAPNNFYYGSSIVRNSPIHLRKIIGTFTFTEYEPHFIRFRSVANEVSRQLPIDYFEFVPQSIYYPTNGLPETRD